MAYIDAHAHLGSRQFDHNRDEMIARMLAKNVSKAIVICCGMHDLEHGIRLRNKNPGFKLAMGIHPQDLEEDNQPERMERFTKAVKDAKPDMIGEIGLDYYSHPHTKEFQKTFFIEQLKLAAKMNLPVDIHSRKASADTLEILKQYPARGIIHSYSGSAEMAALYIKLGYFISFGASVLFPNAKKPAAVIASVPLEKLLIETDAPYQSPVKDRVHEPQDVINIYKAISTIKQIPMDELEPAVDSNFDQVFAQ
ncbi:MAG: TatD family hydrolase [Solobacterium sp.]|nr:TatD family hydrolase [Solobacterium sp.]